MNPRLSPKRQYPRTSRLMDIYMSRFGRMKTHLWLDGRSFVEMAQTIEPLLTRFDRPVIQYVIADLQPGGFPPDFETLEAQLEQRSRMHDNPERTCHEVIIDTTMPAGQVREIVETNHEVISDTSSELNVIPNRDSDLLSWLAWQENQEYERFGIGPSRRWACKLLRQYAMGLDLTAYQIRCATQALKLPDGSHRKLRQGEADVEPGRSSPEDDHEMA